MDSCISFNQMLNIIFSNVLTKDYGMSLEKYTQNISDEEIINNINSEFLLENISNKDARLQHLMQNEFGIVEQFFWQKTRVFAIDLTEYEVNKESNDSELFLNLAFIRYLFEQRKKIHFEPLPQDRQIINRFHKESSRPFGVIRQKLVGIYGIYDESTYIYEALTPTHNLWGNIYKNVREKFGLSTDKALNELDAIYMNGIIILSNKNIIDDNSKIIKILKQISNFAKSGDIICIQQDIFSGYMISKITGLNKELYNEIKKRAAKNNNDITLDDRDTDTDIDIDIDIDTEELQENDGTYADKPVKNEYNFSNDNSELFTLEEDIHIKVEKLYLYNTESQDKTILLGYVYDFSKLYMLNSDNVHIIFKDEEDAKPLPGRIVLNYNKEKNNFSFTALDIYSNDLIENYEIDNPFEPDELKDINDIKTKKYFRDKILNTIFDVNVRFFLNPKTTKVYINCGHYCIEPNLWIPLLNSYFDIIKKYTKDKNFNENTYLNYIAQFCYLFIQIMPCYRGSAAISEWLMHGLAKAKNIKLGNFNSEAISWDYSAFCELSPEEYGKNFKDFFQPPEKKSLNKLKI